MRVLAITLLTVFVLSFGNTTIAEKAQNDASFVFFTVPGGKDTKIAIPFDKGEVELVALYRGNNLYLQPFKNLKFQVALKMERTRARVEDRFSIPKEVRKEMKRLAITPKTPKAFFWGTVEVPRTPATNFGFLLRKKKGEEYEEIHKYFADQQGDEERTGVIVIRCNETVSVYEYTPETGLLRYDLNRAKRHRAAQTVKRLLKSPKKGEKK